MTLLNIMLQDAAAKDQQFHFAFICINLKFITPLCCFLFDRDLILSMVW
jgi:hypothetical protein